MKVTACFTDGRASKTYTGVESAHQHGDNGEALLDWPEKGHELELSGVQCLHVRAEGDE